ncbi:MAG: hypothetical protein REI93_06955, partial [Pedobacter sp.]|nr:hypothetical protein [Pedobacter sp.]
MKKSLQLLVLLVSLSLFAVFSASAQNCTVNAGINTTICPGTPFTLTGVASGLINTPAVWTQVGGPSVTVSSTNVVGTAATATVTGYATDVAYTFRLSAKCTDGSLVYQDVVYTASSIQTANAGPDRYVCVGTTALQGSALNTGETGAWTLISGTGPTPATPSSPTSNLTFTTQSAIQTATYRWTVSKTTNGNTCTSFDDVVITNLGTAAVNAGSDINLSCYNVTTSTNLSGSNAPASATYGQSVLWTFVSGPSTPTISNTAIRNPSVSNLVQGTYVFRYTVTGPCVSGSDEVSVIVAAASQNITGQSNSTQTYCDGRTTVVLNGAKPLYAGETGAWTRVAGTGTVTDATAYNTTATGVSTGSQFRWTITNPSTGCTSQGTITITLISPPTISIT